MPTKHREWFRENCEGRVVATVDRDQCLLVYPPQEWERVEKQLMALPAFQTQARRMQRLMVGHATDLQLDGHGRLQLTPELREFAALQRQIMLVGQGSHFELWDEARWLEQRESWLKSEESGGDLSAELGSLSL